MRTAVTLAALPLVVDAIVLISETADEDGDRGVDQSTWTEKSFMPGEFFPTFNDVDKLVLQIDDGKTQLPPPQFDRPYLWGRLLLIQIPDEHDLRLMCNDPEPPVYACASLTSSQCIIYHGTEENLVKHGWTLNIVLRHEIAHCNGWLQ